LGCSYRLLQSYLRPPTSESESESGRGQRARRSTQLSLVHLSLDPPASMSEHRHNLRSRKSAQTLDASAPAEPAAVAVANKDKADPHGDHDEELEFGGAVGTFAMMTGFPALFYYLYACLFFFDGEPRSSLLVAPLSSSDSSES